MIRTVVAFESEQMRTTTSALLQKNGIPVRYLCRTGLEVIRAIKKMGGGVVICGSMLRDMSVDDLYYELRKTALFLVVAKPTDLELCESEDVFRLPIPAHAGEFSGSVQMLVQLDQKRSRAALPKRNNDDKMTIQKAKERIMDKNKMTEEQAYRFLQHKSMETSTPMAEVAKLVLDALG